MLDLLQGKHMVNSSAWEEATDSVVEAVAQLRWQLVTETFDPI
jgi:hypothetical protein